MNESISRLMDGDLDDATVETVCHALKHGDAMTTWACYHVISDGMRGSANLSPGFSARFARALACEPTILAPAGANATAQSRAMAPMTRRAANVVWAMAASVAAAAVVGWTAFSMVDTPPTAVARARDASSVRAAFVKPATLVPSDYLLAHAEYSPAATVAQVPPAFFAASVATSVASPVAKPVYKAAP